MSVLLVVDIKCVGDERHPPNFDELQWAGAPLYYWLPETIRKAADVLRCACGARYAFATEVPVDRLPAAAVS